MSIRQLKVLGTKNWFSVTGCQINCYNNVQNVCKFSTNSTNSPKICVIGAGPAGFYASQQILRTLPNAQIDIIEKLPVPFGLVRFGVAPDHPEVKNVMSTFIKVAENPRVRFLGNLALGKDFSLKDVREAYNAVLLCYGASQDRKMGINDEDANVISAREFVAWYNGLPDCDESNERVESQLQKSDTVTVIGQGNVSVDVARIILSPIDKLAKTDITSRSLSVLADSNVRRVYLVGRRGPLQAAFTIKELREMLNLSNVDTIWRESDFSGIDESIISKLPRPNKRIVELMTKQLSKTIDTTTSVKKKFYPVFFRGPKQVENLNDVKRLFFTVNRLSETGAAIATNETEALTTNMILRSIGYKSTNVTHKDDLLNFDTSKGLVRNIQGRVLKTDENSAETMDNDANKYEAGLYVSGWLGTGPTGVILTTMSHSFLVAKNMCEDIQTGKIYSGSKPGLDPNKYTTAITWNDWLKIDKYETELGASNSKPREKILQTSKMLEIVK